jgi:hypothetical protein
MEYGKRKKNEGLLIFYFTIEYKRKDVLPRDTKLAA